MSASKKLQLIIIQSLVCLAPFLSLGLGSTKHPVIFVPGDGGSQLEVKLNKTTAPHFYCDKHTSSFSSIWLNLEEITPGFIDCFVDNMRLEYDNKTRTTHNPHGVYIRVPGFGNTSSIEWLDPSEISISVAYFYQIVRALVQAGFVRKKSLRGAPFDFRKAPNEMGEYYKNLKQLIEDTYAMNNYSKVLIVAHSLGNPVFLYFLNHQTQAWKDKYIYSMVSLAGVWAGTVKPLRLYASGDSLGIYVVDPFSIRKQQRSMSSTAFLMPSPRFWNSSEVLVYTDKFNYTVADYKRFFKDIDYMNGWEMRKDTSKLIDTLVAPGVSLHLMHGINVPTPAKMVYGKGEFPNTYPKTINGNGDGTVDIRSLLAFQKWLKEQSQPIEHIPIKGVDHMSILKTPVVIKRIISLALGES